MNCEPWDGVWSEELLRDLTQGSTRLRGRIDVQIRTGFRVTDQVRVERNSEGFDKEQPTWTPRREVKVYRIDGAMMTARAAVLWLNQKDAVPINEDGTRWKVRRVYVDSGC